MKGNIKLIVGILIGALISGVVTYAATATFLADNVMYHNRTVQDALDTLYEMATGIRGSGAFEKDEQLIPNMTANDAPSGTASASSAYSGRPAYLAFSGRSTNLSDGTTFWYTTQTNSEYIQYTWDDEVIIDYIEFKHHVETAVTIQYLNDQNIWTDIYYFPVSGSGDRVSLANYYLPSSIKTTAIRFQFDEGSKGFLSKVTVSGMKKI